jgi:hypothetical protein
MITIYNNHVILKKFKFKIYIYGFFQWISLINSSFDDDFIFNFYIDIFLTFFNTFFKIFNVTNILLSFQKSIMSP